MKKRCQRKDLSFQVTKILQVCKKRLRRVNTNNLAMCLLLHIIGCKETLFVSVLAVKLPHKDAWKVMAHEGGICHPTMTFNPKRTHIKSIHIVFFVIQMPKRSQMTSLKERWQIWMWSMQSDNLRPRELPRLLKGLRYRLYFVTIEIKI